jgi:hypothetical protein
MHRIWRSCRFAPNPFIEKMKKTEVVWLIVRLIGVYFAYLAVVSVFSLAGAVSAMYSLSSQAPAGKAETETNRLIPAPFPARAEPEAQPANKLDPSGEKLRSEAFKTILLYIFLTAAYGAIGIYLITKGRILFDILNNESSSSRKETDPTVTTLDL